MYMANNNVAILSVMAKFDENSVKKLKHKLLQKKKKKNYLHQKMNI